MTFDRELFKKTFHSFHEVSPWLFPALAAEKLAAGSGAAGTLFMFGGFLALAAGGVLPTVKNGERHNRKRFARFGKLTAQNRLYGFYRQNVFQNDKYGKEVRIFDERELIEEEFGKVQKDNRDFIKSIGKDEGSFKVANSVVNTFLSGIACLYTGVNAYRELISVGNVVKYSGAVAQFFTGLTRVAAGMADLRGNAPFLRQHYEFLELEEPESGGKEALPASDAVEISFEHVYFRYPGTEQRVREMYAGTDSCLYREYDEQGILISGGEAQKLAIAKTLYKDAPVFIMDEPSAALDPVSEAQLHEKTNTQAAASATGFWFSRAVY